MAFQVQYVGEDGKIVEVGKPVSAYRKAWWRAMGTLHKTEGLSLVSIYDTDGRLRENVTAEMKQAVTARGPNEDA